MDKKTENEILKKLDKLNEKIQGITLAEYTEMLKSPGRMIWVNFLAGLARGLGIAVGATVLGALFLIILFKIGQLNLPVIGKFIAQIIKIVETYL